jgi:hypothetical protein
MWPFVALLLVFWLIVLSPLFRWRDLEEPAWYDWMLTPVYWASYVYGFARQCWRHWRYHRRK